MPARAYLTLTCALLAACAASAQQPLGAYTETVQSGRLLFVSGTNPNSCGRPEYIGTLGRDLDLAAGQQAARLATLNALPPHDSISARWTG